MGTSEILEALKENDELTAAEIVELVDTSRCAVHVCIRRLIKDVTVELKVRHLSADEKLVKYGHSVGRVVKIYSLDE